MVFLKRESSSIVMMRLLVLPLLLSMASGYSFHTRKTVKMSLSNNVAKVAKAGIVAAAITIVGVSPALAGDVEAGSQLFSVNCAACHAGGQNVIMPEKTLEKEALDQYLSGGRSEDSVVNQVTNGKNAMPAFGGRLSDDDIANVASYVIKTSEAGWSDD